MSLVVQTPNNQLHLTAAALREISIKLALGAATGELYRYFKVASVPPPMLAAMGTGSVPDSVRSSARRRIFLFAGRL